MSNIGLERAISLIKQGKFESGGKIIVALIKQNPSNEHAWWWLYFCAKTTDQKINCLQKVLEINPRHNGARVALDRLNNIKLGKQRKIQYQISKSSRTKRKKKNREKEKDSQENLSPSEESKPDETHVFNIEVYDRVIKLPGEDLIAKSKKPPADFPQVDSGMYGSRLFIGGILISPNDPPKCVQIGHVPHKSQCFICEFFAEADCPVRNDLTILLETKTLFTQRKRYWLEYHERRQSLVEAIYDELKAHGRPLHYEILTKIVRDRYPKLKIKSRSVLRLMSSAPEKFEWINTGVYKAK